MTLGLIGDAGALAFSGEIDTSELLALTSSFQQENDFLVWTQILTSLATVKAVFSDDAATLKGLQTFTLRLISPAVERLGWDPRPDDDLLTSQLRGLLLLTAGANGHESVIKQAQTLFRKHNEGDTSAINPSLRAAVFGIVIRCGGTEEYEALKKDWLSDVTVDGKEISLRALARFQNIDLFPDFLNFLMTEVAVQDFHTAATALATNSVTRGPYWKYIQDNFEPLFTKLSGNMNVWERFIGHSLRQFTDLETEREISEFFALKDQRGYDRMMNIISDTIKGRAAYKVRDANTVASWLASDGYTS